MIEGESLPVDHAALLLDMLQGHAQAVVDRNPSNAKYAERVLERRAQVEELLLTRQGAVEGIVSTWIDDFRPLAQELFGVEATDVEAMQLPVIFGDYSPTLLPGISAKIRRTSLDEIMGPLLSLDLAATQA